MRVSSGVRGWGASFRGDAAAGPEKSPRSEAVADLFNNPLSGDEQRRDVKVRLSHASRRLNQELSQKVADFLKENSEVRQHLDQVPVDPPPRTREALQVRQLTSYLHWMRIYDSAEGAWEASDHEQPYLSIHALGKNEEIGQIFADQDHQRQAVQKERQRHAPSYYYQAFPEAYSFN